MRDELNELDPAYLEDNDITNHEINDSIQQSEHFKNIIETGDNITQEIITDMDNRAIFINNLINNIRNDYIPILEEIAEMRMQ